MEYKDKILNLKKQNPSLGTRKIAEKVGCSRTVVRYHLNPGLHSRILERNNNSRREKRLMLVKMMGGKCFECGFDKYTTALDFHHINPNTKIFTLAKISSCSMARQIDEAKKCILLCSNCHRAYHSGEIHQTPQSEKKIEPNSNQIENSHKGPGRPRWDVNLSKSLLISNLQAAT